MNRILQWTVKIYLHFFFVLLISFLLKLCRNQFHLINEFIFFKTTKILCFCSACLYSAVILKISFYFSGQVRIIAATSPHIYEEDSDDQICTSRARPKSNYLLNQYYIRNENLLFFRYKVHSLLDVKFLCILR